MRRGTRPRTPRFDTSRSGLTDHAAAFIAQFREPACTGIDQRKDAGIMIKIDQTVSHIAFHKLLVP